VPTVSSASSSTNRRELQRALHGLERDGHAFGSETDAEVVVAHLIKRHYSGDLAAVVQAAAREFEGLAFVATHRNHPGLLVGTRRQRPLVAGLGDGETFLASSRS